MHGETQITFTGASVLTPREHEILGFIVFGKTNHEIAVILKISEKTVEWHRLNLMKKIGAHKAADLVRYALKHQLVENHGEIHT